MGVGRKYKEGEAFYRLAHEKCAVYLFGEFYRKVRRKIPRIKRLRPLLNTTDCIFPGVPQHFLSSKPIILKCNG